MTTPQPLPGQQGPSPAKASILKKQKTSPGPGEPLSPRSPGKASSSFRKMQPLTTNKNVEWVGHPGAWALYTGAVLTAWLVFTLFVDPGIAWTYTHIAHGVATYCLFHWAKGSSVEMDQGQYDHMTFWEQIDGEVLHTSNRKFLLSMPVVLFLLATHGTDYRRQPLLINLVVLFVMVVAKLPHLHGVRILGINKY